MTHHHRTPRKPDILLTHTHTPLSWRERYNVDNVHFTVHVYGRSQTPLFLPLSYSPFFPIVTRCFFTFTVQFCGLFVYVCFSQLHKNILSGTNRQAQLGIFIINKPGCGPARNSVYSLEKYTNKGRIEHDLGQWLPPRGTASWDPDHPLRLLLVKYIYGWPMDPWVQWR